MPYLVSSHDPSQLSQVRKEEPCKVVNIQEKVETKENKDNYHHNLGIFLL